MTDSILTSVKKPLGLSEDYTVFDSDIIMYINTAFSTLNELGLGPSDGFAIEDKSPVWNDFLMGDKRKNSVKTYVTLRARLLFDPPTTGYLMESLKEQIKEFEWRLNTIRENDERPEVISIEDLDNGSLVVDGGVL